MTPHNSESVDCGAFCEVIFFCISPKILLGGFFDSLSSYYPPENDDFVTMWTRAFFDFGKISGRYLTEFPNHDRKFPFRKPIPFFLDLSQE